MRRGPWGPLLAALLTLLPAPAFGQVFFATHPDPSFEIGPLFVRASVSPALGPVDVDLSWSIAVPPRTSATDIEQDIYLLWPSAIVPDPDVGSVDPGLQQFVEERGLTVIDGGRVRLTARNLYRTDEGRRETVAGGAPVVTFIRAAGPMGLTAPASLIRIPWDPRAANRSYLMRLHLRTRGLLKSKPRTWFERTFWGERHRLALSFSEVRQRGMFPLYLEHRDRVIRLSEDPAQMMIDFADSDHLKIDELSPQSARRALSETRDSTDTVSMFIDRSAGLNPQVLTVQFGYFSPLQSWAPVLIPVVFFLLGNLAGVLVRTVAERLSKQWAGRVGFWRRRAPEEPRRTGIVLEASTLARLVPGVTSYDEVLDLCGHEVEERQTLTAPDRRTLLYRGRRLVPHRRRLAGLLAAVTHWDTEDHEVEIVLDRGLVSDVQAHVRRSRVTDPAAAGR